MTAPASEALSDGHPLGDHPSLRLVTRAFILAQGVFAWGWVSAPPNDLGNVLTFTPPLVLITALFHLLGTVRIVGDPTGYVELVNPFVVHRVPVEEIQRVDTTQGLRLVLRSGDELASAAYEQSLAGHLLGYPRSVGAAQRLELFRRSLRLTAWQWSPGQRPVETHLRLRGITLGVSFGAFLLFGAAVLNLLRAG